MLSSIIFILFILEVREKQPFVRCNQVIELLQIHEGDTYRYNIYKGIHLISINFDSIYYLFYFIQQARAYSLPKVIYYESPLTVRITVSCHIFLQYCFIKFTMTHYVTCFTDCRYSCYLLLSINLNIRKRLYCYIMIQHME